jgi:hypothetical protein
MSNDFETEESREDVELHEVRAGDAPAMTIGVAQQTRHIFIRGDLHPLGSATALLTAAAQHVPYIQLNAVNVLFPLEWLRGECQHDMDRLRIIANIEAFVRSGFSQGARVMH